MIFLRFEQVVRRPVFSFLLLPACHFNLGRVSTVQDNEAAVRKLAMCVLKRALASRARPPAEGLEALAMHWDAYQLLYDSMDNFAAHLIVRANACWEERLGGFGGLG